MISFTLIAWPAIVVAYCSYLIVDAMTDDERRNKISQGDLFKLISAAVVAMVAMLATIKLEYIADALHLEVILALGASFGLTVIASSLALSARKKINS